MGKVPLSSLRVSLNSPFDVFLCVSLSASKKWQEAERATSLVDADVAHASDASHLNASDVSHLNILISGIKLAYF